ncbi:Putative FYVE zinc finger, Zinc finger, RING-type, Zinc finger, FYVE/PHD-type [Septoria linicola]|uniref:FYVE zinc finger, Zinc finger, RING-type, Zinc finger, FYVE/PHD-type n=1 Tax=Septoria linicola TaxID=215465 RepID=A0A9Q9ALS7_9PEZI|nr:putative FYVE zinc finger, Zinc finger, RING-type, Zinc finger, FYVE/PHD-type [Septoria linicola]USW49313.1 Putative FYVE zinc finger, Zinc finger, RING-type, Zinc finger, FYVE/PHD-type [Septoria linicola]
MSRPRHDADQALHEDNNDLTFLDFLRSAGGTVSISNDRAAPQHPQQHRYQQYQQQQQQQQQQQGQSRNDSAERKRRHTGSEPERRSYPYPAYSGRPSIVHGSSRSSSAQQPGGSVESAIDLTATSPPSRPIARPGYSRMSHSNGSLSSRGIGYGSVGRRESDMVLPQWQPDHEVSKCPVCETDFSLWYRRHHCRKCGRVVCARCSPHRITIPRQYIVQPPDLMGLYTDDGSTSPPNNPALGGGEVVRVCNPCVPDPWTPDVASPSLTSTHPANIVGARTSSLPQPAQPQQQQDQSTRGQPDRYRSIPMPAGGRNRAQSHQQTNDQQRRHNEFTRLLASSSNLDRYSRYLRYPQAGMLSQMGSEPSQALNSQHSDAMHRRGNSYSTGLPYNRGPPPVPGSHPAQMLPRLPPQPRRQIAEEDECPVCGNEMPPGEAVRERHINECIAARMAPHSASTPPVAPSAAANIVPSTTTGTSPPQAEGSRPRTTSFRPRGMVQSTATEKDCIEADGEPRECPICYEDFQPGDELGRMECLCLFHRDCIRGWWERKGAGSCPTPHFD